jgi:GNAT superfamily N-acetyltransferase
MISVERTPVDGLDEWLDVRNRVDPDDPLELALLVRARERDRARVDLLARVEGVAAGVGFYQRLIDNPQSRLGRAVVRVLPEFRRRGVATALHRELSAIGREHGDEELEGQVAAPTAATDAYCAARGYRPVERMYESRLTLTEPRPEPGSVNGEGVVVRSAAEDPEVLRDAYAIALESEPDIPQAREWTPPRDYDDWRSREIDDALFVPEASVVVYADDKPAAYGIVVIEREGLGAHYATGVARAFRGRGFAQALKRAQIVRAREAGLRELVAWNDESNAAMRHVNAKLGYRVTREVVTYRGPLL